MKKTAAFEIGIQYGFESYMMDKEALAMPKFVNKAVGGLKSALGFGAKAAPTTPLKMKYPGDTIALQRAAAKRKIKVGPNVHIKQKVPVGGGRYQTQIKTQPMEIEGLTGKDFTGYGA